MRWLLALVVIACALTAPVALAVNVSAKHGLSDDLVEIGDPVTLTLHVSLDEKIEPRSPEVKVPPSFTVSSANASKFEMNIMGHERLDYTVRWVIIPDEVGTFEIGPPTVLVGKTRVKAKGKLTLKVVGKGKAPPRPGQPRRRRRKLGSSFFAPQSPFDLDDPFFEYDTPRKRFDSRRDLKLDRPVAPSAFLYIHADKTKAVVGEQITLSYWVYFNVHLMGVEDYQEPSLAAFTREALSVPAEMRGRAVDTSVGGRLWAAKQYHEVAVFPVRAGKLSTGKWSGTVEILRGRGRYQLKRESNEVIIDVSEPPTKGRPLGFKSGTVGRFKVDAEVEPRKTHVGGTTTVNVQVTGVGQLPSELRLPSRLGIEWMKPTRKDGLSMVHGLVGGWRTFDYAVRFTEPGEVDLGSVELPYWDPDRKKYEVATAELGKVTVLPSNDDGAKAPTKNTGGEEKRDPFAGIGGPRSALRPFDADTAHGMPPRTLWTWVLVPPVGVAFSSLILAGLRRARRRREEKRDDPAQRAKKALQDVASATSDEDAAAAAERAVHLAIEASTSLKSRGMLEAELEERLAKALDDGALTEEALALLRACAAIRFEPVRDEEAGHDDIPARARKVVEALLAK
jgi:hypothetical protein